MADTHGCGPAASLSVQWVPYFWCVWSLIFPCRHLVLIFPCRLRVASADVRCVTAIFERITIVMGRQVYSSVWRFFFFYLSWIMNMISMVTRHMIRLNIRTIKCTYTYNIHSQTSTSACIDNSLCCHSINKLKVLRFRFGCLDNGFITNKYWLSTVDNMQLNSDFPYNAQIYDIVDQPLTNTIN